MPKFKKIVMEIRSTEPKFTDDIFDILLYFHVKRKFIMMTFIPIMMMKHIH